MSGQPTKPAQEEGSPGQPDRDRTPIGPLVKRLRLTDPIRQAAMALLEGRQTDLSNLPMLLREIRKPSVARWRECAAAAWLLGRLPLTPRQELEVAQLLGAIAEGKRPSDFSASGCGRCVPLAGLLSLVVSSAVFIGVLALPSGEFVTNFEGTALGLRIVSGFLLATITFLVSFIPFLSVLAPLVVPASRLLDRRRMRTARLFAAQTLGVLRVPLSIGPLARAMRGADNRVRDAARQALRSTLPVLTPEHYGRIPPGAVTGLCETLPDPEEAFTLEVLEALEKVGSGRAVPTVESVAASGATARVREQAARILPTLYERRQREKDAARLLRSSQAPADSDRLLLRPVRDTGLADAEQLLRSADVHSREP